MDFRLLGPFEAWHEGVQVQLGDRQLRHVLIVLLLNAGKPVSGERLIEIVWGDKRPGTNPVPGYISKIRGLLREHRTEGVSLRNTQTGYLLKIGPDTLDTGRFAALRTEAAASADPDTAKSLLRQAVDLWRGRFLEDIDIDRVGGPDVVVPDESLIDSVCDLAEMELVSGDPRWVRDRLRPLVRVHPERHRLGAFLMRALLATGDRVEAMRVYHETIEALAGYGMEPPEELRALARTVQYGTARDSLPRRPERFIGRVDALHKLFDPVKAVSCSGTVWISGSPGVGKTTFAVEAAHRLAERFPDARLFVALDGFTPKASGLATADALAALLADLGVPDEQVPRTEHARAALYRQRMAGTRSLVILDNAASDEQVAPLLLDDPSCLVLVTSRTATLIASGNHIRLHPFAAVDGAAQFRSLVPVSRLRGPDASKHVDDVVVRCGGLPLYIRIAAAHLLRHEHWSVSHLAALLREAGQWRADRDNPGVSSILVSYRHLTDPQRNLFRLFGLLPGRDFGVPIAAALGGYSIPVARALLEELHAASLLEERGPERYHLLDPLKEFAASLPDPDSSGDAVDRLVDFTLAASAAAVAAAFPFARDQQPEVDETSPVVPLFAGRDDALAWLAVERPTLVALVEYAGANARPGSAWRLAVLLWRFLYISGRLKDWLSTLETARAYVGTDLLGSAHVLLRLSAAYWQVGRLTDAKEAAVSALSAWEELADPRGEADCLCAIAAVTVDLGDAQQAVAYLEAALTKYEGLDDSRGRANALSMLGHIDHQRGVYRAAARHQRAATGLLRTIGNLQGLAHALDNLGSTLQHLDEITEAVSHHHAAIDLARECGDRVAEAYAVNNLGNAHRRSGRPAEALRHHEAAGRLAAEVSDRNLATQLLLDHAETSLAMGDAATSLELWREALTLSEQTGDLGKGSHAHRGIARVLHALGRHGEAVSHWENAGKGFSLLGMPEAALVVVGCSRC